MKKIIIVVTVISAVGSIVWFIFVQRPVFLNRFFPQKTASEPAVVSSGFNEQLNGLNPYEEAYTNPFE